MSTYPSVFDMIFVTSVAPARSFCRHLRAPDGIHLIEAHEPDARGRFSSREVWYGTSEGIGMLIMQWLEVRGYEAVNGGRALHA